MHQNNYRYRSLISHVSEIVDLLLVSAIEDLCKAFERILNVFPLKSAYLKELKPNALCESHAILRSHRHSILKIDLICDHNAHKLATRILLFYTFQPLAQEMESVWVRHVIDQHDEISLSEQLESDLLEDVLAGDVNKMKLYSLV